LRKTAFTNLKNQFRALNEQQRSVGSTNVLNNTTNNNPSSPSDKTNDNVNSTSANRLPVNQVTASGSFSTLNHHSHNTVPGKDLRESVIKTLETINRGRSTKKWKIFTKKDKKKEVFGVPLVTSLEYAFVYIDPSENSNNKKIPIVVYECINFLRKNGLTKEGIFRVNGSERRINNSLKVFNENAGYGFGFDFDGMNVFDAASLLKLYLRQLPEPLIPFCLYNSFLDVIKFIPDTTEKIQAFQYLFMMLPTSHLVLLEILLQFLSEIIQHFDENHMNAHNLACIFAPNLLRSKESSSSANLLNLSSSEEYEVALQVIEFLLNHKDKFCITSPDVKPFQLCNKIDGISSSSNLNNINSLSLTDFPTFKRSSLFFRFSSIGSSKNISTDHNSSNTPEKDKSSRLKNEIKAEDDSNDAPPKISQDPSSNSISHIPPNKTSVTFSIDNTKSNKVDPNENTNATSNNNGETEKEADPNATTYHPNVDRNSYSNNVSPTLSGLTIKSKSNLENVCKHSDDSFYQLSTCALVSTSLNRLNYPLIKNKNYYEYLTKDNDTITPALANEKVSSPTTTNNVENQKENASTLPKESISVASFNKSFGDITSNEVDLVRKSELPNEEKDIQDYPSNVINAPQKNRDRGISFISPLSTPTKPVFCIPPPPASPPLE